MAKPTNLQAAAQAVLKQWDSPRWEWHLTGPTADLMHILRFAIEDEINVQNPAHPYSNHQG